MGQELAYPQTDPRPSGRVTRLDRDKVQTLLARADGADRAVRGQALEDVVIHLFESIDGVQTQDVRVVDEPAAQELDAVFTNQQRGPLRYLPHLLLVECKN